MFGAFERAVAGRYLRARKGERFNDLIRDNSDALSAKQGGDLGGWKKGDLRPDMEAAVWDKAKGFVADPIRVPAGFEILRVDEHVKEGQASLEDVESEIKERLYMPLYQPKIREYLTELRGQAFLEIRVSRGVGWNPAWQSSKGGLVKAPLHLRLANPSWSLNSKPRDEDPQCLDVHLCDVTREVPTVTGDHEGDVGMSLPILIAFPDVP